MNELNVTFKADLPVDTTLHPAGQELAVYLKDQFTQSGILIEKIDNYDDVGWALDTTVDGKKLLILLGYLNDGDCQWLMQFDEYKSSFKDIFKWKKDLTACQKLAEKVREVFDKFSAIQDVQWHTGYYKD